jgi:hypothetical protein
MATYVIYADAADGWVYSQNATYTTARSGGTLAADNSGAVTAVGQRLATSVYYCHETFLSFDTSSVVGTPDSASLELYGYSSDTDGVGGWTVNARAYDWGASLTTGDWIAGASLSGNALRATFASSSFATSAYNAFTAESTFKDNLANPVRLVLSSSRHEAGTVPANSTTTGDAADERLIFQTTDTSGTSQDPKLTIVAYVSRTYTADAVVANPPGERVYTADAIVKSVNTRTFTADATIENGTRVLEKITRGEAANNNLRVYGATNGQAYRLYDSGGSTVASAVVTAGVAEMTNPGTVTGGRLVGFTDNTYATSIEGQWWRGDFLEGNVFSANPAAIPDSGLSVVADNASYYYATSQFGSRGQIVETENHRFVLYRTGGIGSSYGAANGEVQVVRIDRASGRVDQGPVQLRSGIGDGHEVFLLGRTSSGTLRFVYGGQYEHLYMRVSSAADDVTSWGSATQITSGGVPESFAGTLVIDSGDNNHIIGVRYSGGALIYGYSTNAAPTSFTWTTIANESGTLSTGWGGLFGDAVIEESGGQVYLHTAFGSYGKSGGFGAFTAYRWAYYLKVRGGSSPAAYSAGGSSVSLPRSFDASTGEVAGADEISDLYHYGSWFKIAQVGGTPYVLLDNDRNNLPVGNAPGNQSVAVWNGSAWSIEEIPDLPMWYDNPNTSDPAETREVVNANFGVNIQSRGSSVFVYACIGYCTQPSLDTTYDGFRLVRFRSSDGFATYTTDTMIEDGYGGLTYTDLSDGGAKRGFGVGGAGFAYPKVPEDPSTVMFSLVDLEYSTVAIASLTEQTYTADAIVRSQPGLTYTADAQIVARLTRTYTADAVVVTGTPTTASRTYTADARVLATTTRTYTADARVATSSPGPGTPTIVLDTSIDMVAHDTTVSLSDDGTATVTISESSPVT